MIVDTSDTEIAILPETEDNGLPSFAVRFNDRTARAEIQTNKGTFVHPCHNFTGLLRHVQTCPECSEMFLTVDDHERPVWALDCGYKICDSVVDFHRLFRLILDELGAIDWKDLLSEEEGEDHAE